MIRVNTRYRPEWYTTAGNGSQPVCDAVTRSPSVGLLQTRCRRRIRLRLRYTRCWPKRRDARGARYLATRAQGQGSFTSHGRGLHDQGLSGADLDARWRCARSQKQGRFGARQPAGKVAHVSKHRQDRVPTGAGGTQEVGTAGGIDRHRMARPVERAVPVAFRQQKTWPDQTNEVLEQIAHQTAAPGYRLFLTCGEWSPFLICIAWYCVARVPVTPSFS